MTTSSTDDYWPKNGVCSADICGSQAACESVDPGQYRCVCPHELTLAPPSLECSTRNVVPPVPNTIHNIIPPRNLVNDTKTAGNPVELSPTYLAVVVVTISVVSIVVVVTALIFLWRRKRRPSALEKKNKANNNVVVGPVALCKGPLEADQYTTNPQYFLSEVVGHLPVPSLPSSALSLIQPIGEGCFGKVYKGKLETDGGVITVAIKVLKDTASREAEEDFMREVEIMSSFLHSNILSLIGIALHDPSKCPWMIFEFMPYGDLTEVLRKCSKDLKDKSFPLVLDKKAQLSIALQIAHGMHYLAAQHFVHRDLACRNCLVGENLTVKIADFGMSRDVYTCDYYKVGGSRLLPVRWMSPDSITYGRFTLESDVWSFGVVLWEIYSCGKQPYFGHSNEEVVRLILQGIMLVPPEGSPRFICDLMEQCWKTEPRDRVSFTELCRRLEEESQAEEELPLPPPLSSIANLRLNHPLPELDSEDYLLPKPCTSPHIYLQTLPD